MEYHRLILNWEWLKLNKFYTHLQAMVNLRKLVRIDHA